MSRIIHEGSIYKRTAADLTEIRWAILRPTMLSSEEPGMYLTLVRNPDQGVDNLEFFIPRGWIEQQTDLMDAYRGGRGHYVDMSASNYDPERYWTELGQRWLRENTDITPPDYIRTSFPTGRSG